MIEMTDSQKIEEIRKDIKRMRLFRAVGLAITVLSFIGIISLPQLIKKFKQ